MKNLLFILLFFGLNAASQTVFPLYIPTNPDSIKQVVNVNGAPRQVYNIDLTKYRSALTARDTAAALRLLISSRLDSNTVKSRIRDSISAYSIQIDTTALGQGSTPSPLTVKASYINSLIAQYLQGLPGWTNNDSMALRGSLRWVATPPYLTWFMIGSDMEQYNSSMGMRKKSTATAAWTTNGESEALQTLSVGQKVVMKVSSNPALATTLILAAAGVTPNESTGAGELYSMYAGAGLTAAAQPRQGGTNFGSTFSIAAGDLLRLNYTTGVITWEQSTNGGTTWTVRQTSSVAPSGTYYMWLQSYSPLAGYDEIYKQ